MKADHVARPAPGALTDQALWTRAAESARCADGDLDPDEWFPVSAYPEVARQEAAAAITVGTACLVCSECPVLSPRHWDIGQHGVWGGLVAPAGHDCAPAVQESVGSPLPEMRARPTCRGCGDGW